MDDRVMMEFPELIYEGKPALPPQTADLERLHKLIVDNFCVTVLEFGCGYSTFVIADALRINRARWEALENKPEVRNSQMFKCRSVDTNTRWIQAVSSGLNNDISGVQHSDCSAIMLDRQMCHCYTKTFNIVPDFIYIDGPDPKQITNDNGFWSNCPERTPMSADLLMMEPTLIPGTIVLIDGRTNNARFLKRNLKRLWSFEPNAEEDYTLMRLEEPRLGKINVIGRDIVNHARSA
jgi:hypothetical protein